MRNALVGLGLVFGLAGCATMFSGSQDSVTINSNPAGATVLVNGLEMGRTPMTAMVRRGAPGTVTLRMDGYEDRSFQLQSKFNAVTLVNLFFWPGFIIDAVTGAITKYDPTAYSVTMEAARSDVASSLGVDHVVLAGELERTDDGALVIPSGASGLRVAIVDELTQQAVIWE